MSGKNKRLNSGNNSYSINKDGSLDTLDSKSAVSDRDVSIEAEQMMLEEDADFGEFGDEEEEKVLLRPDKNSNIRERVILRDDSEEKSVSTLQMFIKSLPNMLIIMASLLFLAISALFRGGEAYPSIIGVEVCGKASWLIFFVT